MYQRKIPWKMRNTITVMIKVKAMIKSQAGIRKKILISLNKKKSYVKNKKKKKQKKLKEIN